MLGASKSKIPLIILGGRDRGPAALPTAAQSRHLLRGYKAIDLKIDGRPLIVTLIERFRNCGRFDPIYLGGPRQIYRDLLDDELRDVHLIETDGSFGDNLRISAGVVSDRHPDHRLAVATSDILPDPIELDRVLRDYESRPQSDFWGVLVPVPENLERLGESTWKPKYSIQLESQERPVYVLPGHLVIGDPQALRLELLYRTFDIAYRTRNRSVRYRFWTAVWGILLALASEDLKRLLSLRRPNFAWEILSTGWWMTRDVRRGAIGQRALERGLGHLWVDDRHRRRHPENRGWITYDQALSLAKDIDTEEEAQELAARRPGTARSTPRIDRVSVQE